MMEVYSGDDKEVRGKVLGIIYDCLSQIKSVGTESFSEDTVINAHEWAKLKEKLVLTHQFIVRDNPKSEMTVKDVLSFVSFATN